MKQNLPGGDSAVVPPDPMPNSEVKRRSADGSVGSPHVRVGNCQASNTRRNLMRKHGVFLFACCLPGNTHRGRMSAINGQASNQSEARPHGRAFCVLTRVITQMKQRIGSAMVVMIGSPANHKPHIRVKSYRLRVLLIHVGCESGHQSQSIHD